LACIAHAIAYGSEIRHKLTACLQVEIPDPHLISRLAEGLATRIFADIGISLEWRACEQADESSRTPIVVQLVSGRKDGLMSGVLGSAMPYRRHIIIFFDRIETMEDAPTVLGHVMVHEITHIIQGVPRHSDTGLMKPHWSRHDLVQMRYKPLPFTEWDLLLLYAGLPMRRKSTDTQTVTQ
jgi:hypothetical protein